MRIVDDDHFECLRIVGHVLVFVHYVGVFVAHEVFEQSLTHDPILLVGFRRVNVNVILGKQQVDLHVHRFSHINYLRFGLQIDLVHFKQSCKKCLHIGLLAGSIGTLEN